MYTLSFFFGLALIFGQLASCWAPPAPVQKRGGAQHEAKDKQGAVASESSVCSNIGINLIKDGGNAADAVSGQRVALDGTSAILIVAALITAVGRHSVLYRGDRHVSQWNWRWWLHDRPGY